MHLACWVRVTISAICPFDGASDSFISVTGEGFGRFSPVAFVCSYQNGALSLQATFVGDSTLLCPCPPLYEIYDLSFSGSFDRDADESKRIVDKASVPFALLIEGGMKPLISSAIKYYQVPRVSLALPLSSNGDFAVLIDKEPTLVTINVTSGSFLEVDSTQMRCRLAHLSKDDSFISIDTRPAIDSASIGCKMACDIGDWTTQRAALSVSFDGGGHYTTAGYIGCVKKPEITSMAPSFGIDVGKYPIDIVLSLGEEGGTSIRELALLASDILTTCIFSGGAKHIEVQAISSKLVYATSSGGQKDYFNYLRKVRCPYPGSVFNSKMIVSVRLRGEGGGYVLSEGKQFDLLSAPTAHSLVKDTLKRSINVKDGVSNVNSKLIVSLNGSPNGSGSAIMCSLNKEDAWQVPLLMNSVIDSDTYEGYCDFSSLLGTDSFAHLEDGTYRFDLLVHNIPLNWSVNHKKYAEVYVITVPMLMKISPSLVLPNGNTPLLLTLSRGDILKRHDDIYCHYQSADSITFVSPGQILSNSGHIQCTPPTVSMFSALNGTTIVRSGTAVSASISVSTDGVNQGNAMPYYYSDAGIISGVNPDTGSVRVELH